MRGICLLAFMAGACTKASSTFSLTQDSDLAPAQSIDLLADPDMAPAAPDLLQSLDAGDLASADAGADLQSVQPHDMAQAAQDMGHAQDLAPSCLPTLAECVLGDACCGYPDRQCFTYDTSAGAIRHCCAPLTRNCVHDDDCCRKADHPGGTVLCVSGTCQ